MKNRISHATLHKKRKDKKARKRAEEHRIERLTKRFVQSKPMTIWVSFLTWVIVLGILGGIGCGVFFLGRFIWRIM